MGTSSGSKLQYEYMLGGGVPALFTLPQVMDTTGWKKGAPLLLDTSGHVEVISSGAWGVPGYGSNYIAAHDSLASTADGVVSSLVIMATPQTVFSAVVSHSTTGDAKPAWTQIGNNYAITSATTVSQSSKCWVINIETSGAAGGYVVGLKDTTDTVNGRVYFIASGRLHSTRSPWTGLNAT